METVNVKLPVELREQMVKLANTNERTFAAEVRVAIREHVTKTKGNKSSALRGYHELHLRALRLLTNGGILVTFSCSHHVTAEDWAELLQRAASETNVALRLRRRLGQSSDHPILVNAPETEYLRGYVLERVNEKIE